MAGPRLSPQEKYFARESENTQRIALLEAQIEELQRQFGLNRVGWWAKLWRK